MEDSTDSATDIDERVSDASMTLSTAESRVEYAGVEVESTREAVTDAAETVLIGSRLDGLDTRISSLEAETEDLQESLQRQVQRRNDPAEVEAVRDELDRIESQANDLQMRADELIADASDLERLVEDPPLAAADLEPDVEALEVFQEDLESTIETLRGVVDGEEKIEGDPATVWFEATVRHRFRSLAIADIRAEIEDILLLSDEEDDAVTALRDRFDEVRERLERGEAELEDVAPEAWTERYGDRIEEAEQRVAEFSPPVDWEAATAALESMLSDHRTGDSE
jgi:chromosome segregation ATPase